MLSMHGVLLVEDEALIAMEVARGLAQSGYRVLGPASTVACALALLQGERPDVAILDVNIRGERVTPVARELSALGVPFVPHYSVCEGRGTRAPSSTDAPQADRRCRAALRGR
jgi:DNA-binding NarL/FixJ family response regulator